VLPTNRAPIVLMSVLVLVACELDDEPEFMPPGADETTQGPPATTGDTTAGPLPTTDDFDTTGAPPATTGDPTTGVDSSGTDNGTGDPPSGVPGDFDGDGVLDFVVYTSYSLETFFSRAIVFPGSLDTITADDAIHVFDGGFEGSGSAAVCNVDGEGPPEVVFGGNYDGQDAVSIFQTDGTATIVHIDEPFFRILCEDFDGDGVDDIVLGAYGFNPNNVVGTQVIYGADVVLGTDGPLPQTPVGETGFSDQKLLSGLIDGPTPLLVNAEPGRPNPSNTPDAGAITIYDVSGATPVEIGVIYGSTELENFGNDVHVCDVDGDGVDEITEITDTTVRTWSAIDGMSDAPDTSATIPFTATFGGCEAQRGYIVLSDGSTTGIYQVDGSNLNLIAEDPTLQVVELFDAECAETTTGEIVKLDVDVDAGTLSWGGIININDVDGDSVARQVLPE